MPGSPRSLGLTDLYRGRLLQLQERLTAFVEVRWATVLVQDLDRSHQAWLTSAVVALEQSQRNGVRLTAAYLGGFLASELGRSQLELPRVDEARFVGLASDGRPLIDALTPSLISVKAALKDGKPVGEALEEGRNRGARVAASAVLAAPRAALQEQIETHSMISGWRRVTRGGCGACIAAAAHPYEHEPMRVHDHCHCTQEPIVRDVPDRAPRATGPQIFAGMTPAEQDQALGPAAAQAVREGRVAWPDLIATSPMVVGPDMLTQAPLAALN